MKSMKKSSGACLTTVTSSERTGRRWQMALLMTSGSTTGRLPPSQATMTCTERRSSSWSMLSMEKAMVQVSRGRTAGSPGLAIAAAPKGGKLLSSSGGGAVLGVGACFLEDGGLLVHTKLLCPQRPQEKHRTGSLQSAAAWPGERQRKHLPLIRRCRSSLWRWHADLTWVVEGVECAVLLNSRRRHQHLGRTIDHPPSSSDVRCVRECAPLTCYHAPVTALSHPLGKGHPHQSTALQPRGGS